MDFHNLEQIGFPGLDATLKFIDPTIRKLQRHFLYIAFATNRASIPSTAPPFMSAGRIRVTSRGKCKTRCGKLGGGVGSLPPKRPEREIQSEELLG